MGKLNADTFFFLNKLAKTKLLLKQIPTLNSEKKLYKPIYSASLKKKTGLLKHSMLYK